jgi:hypothetical protein
MPLTWEQYLVNLKSSLQRGLEKSKRSTAENDEIDRSVQRDIFYGIALATSDQSNDQSVSSADQICQNLMINIFPDATYFANNSFVAGPLAIKFPEAEGILFHALGHWYYYFMMSQSDCSKLNFEKTSACLLANHTELSNTELSTQQKLSSQGKETLYQVEDWSDLISTLADEKSKNVACLFAQKLTDEEYKDLSLRNQDAGDSHSSELFRLLHLHFLKNGSLPAQCEQALIARGEKANFKNCLKLAH